MELNPQFYDQLAKRLDRQDSQLDRIEQNQLTTFQCIQKQETAHSNHIASDKSNFNWIKMILSGIGAALLAIVGVLVKH